MVANIVKVVATNARGDEGCAVADWGLLDLGVSKTPSVKSGPLDVAEDVVTDVSGGIWLELPDCLMLVLPDEKLVNEEEILSSAGKLVNLEGTKDVTVCTIPPIAVSNKVVAIWAGVMHFTSPFWTLVMRSDRLAPSVTEALLQNSPDWPAQRLLSVSLWSDHV